MPKSVLPDGGALDRPPSGPPPPEFAARSVRTLLYGLLAWVVALFSGVYALCGRASVGHPFFERFYGHEVMWASSLYAHARAGWWLWRHAWVWPLLFLPGLVAYAAPRWGARTVLGMKPGGRAELWTVGGLIALGCAGFAYLYFTTMLFFVPVVPVLPDAPVPAVGS